MERDARKTLNPEALFLLFQFIQKPLFTRFFIIIAILKASFGNNERPKEHFWSTFNSILGFQLLFHF